ncbi:cyanophycinase [Mucilaginibacter robiniae]|uniref:Cyanophycinase n=1 Tax=Mucilaginibacter robiniae TaxID=2728022 RepID=A0A7L5E074_9SPHI|nr:cyanophycinase [Mucilaginibacter robiniae]QJD96780.1 cyanophycinase [Mucilaginibacter robiniae]
MIIALLFNKKRVTLLFSSLFILSFFSVRAQSGTANTVGPEKGALVIVGGGNVGADIWARFIQLAGGTKARIIYVPTAQEDSMLKSDREIRSLKQAGAQEVVVLHTRDPKVANTEAFVAPIKTATGVWFEGGRQWRLADSYLNTRTQQEFNALLNRGGVIGGTSAGASIQGSFLFRGDTKGNNIIVGDHVQGLGFMHNTAIDQHILKRNRQFDMAEFIKTHPDLLGIGIDESTGIVVQGNRLEVIGISYVCINDYNIISGKEKNPYANGPFFFLQKGQVLDLQTRRIKRDIARANNTGN